MKNYEADWNTWALRNQEREVEKADRRYERNLAEFQRAPYDTLEWEAHKACPYMLMALALELMGGDFGVHYTAPDTTRQEFRDWVNGIIDELDT